jgi:hypothetical protein
VVAQELEGGEEILHQLRAVERRLHLAPLLVGAGVAAERREPVGAEGEVARLGGAPHHVLDVGVEPAVLVDHQHRRERPGGARGLRHEAADRAVALGAFVVAVIVSISGSSGRHLLRERVVRLELFEDHRAGDARGGVLARAGDEVALRHLAVHVAVEDLEDPRVEVAGLLADLSVMALSRSGGEEG